jgi:hypothetical protein
MRRETDPEQRYVEHEIGEREAVPKRGPDL